MTVRATIKQTGAREATITLPMGHRCNLTDQVVVERYWSPATPSGRGYIRHGDQRVTAVLGHRGIPLAATPETLLSTSRAEHK